MITKVLPGTGIELKSGTRGADLSVTGVVTTTLPPRWSDQVAVIDAGDNTPYSLGCRTSDPAMKLIREVMNGIKQLILYRLSTAGVKASAEISSGITAKTVFPDTRGNDLSIVISASDERWLVKAYFGTQEMDSQIISTAADFSSYYVVFSGTETLATTIVKLTGSTDGAVESGYTGFFAELREREYNVTYNTDSDRAADVVSFVEEQNANKAYVQGVVTGIYPDSGNTYVCNSTGGVTADCELMPTESCITLAGLIAQAGIVNSLTYCRGITGWTNIGLHLTHDQQISRTRNGEVLLVPLYGSPSVLYNITNLTTFDEDHPKNFRKSLVIRTLQKYQGDLQRLLDTKRVGKIHNSVEGHAQVRTIVSEMTSQNYLAPGYIEDFSTDDIAVTAGTERDAVNVIAGIKAVDTVGKIYVTVAALQGGIRNGKNKVAGRVLRA